MRNGFITIHKCNGIACEPQDICISQLIFSKNGECQKEVVEMNIRKENQKLSISVCQNVSKLFHAIFQNVMCCYGLL